MFMADKVDSLEKEKKEQAVRIQEQAVRIEQLAAKIQKIDVVVREFSFLKDYLKLNGIIWTITNRNVIVNKMHQLLGEPQTAKGTARDNTVHGGDANYSQCEWDYWTRSKIRCSFILSSLSYPDYSKETLCKVLNLQVMLSIRCSINQHGNAESEVCS